MMKKKGLVHVRRRKMNRGKLFLFALCMSGLLGLASCQSQAPTILPVTGLQQVAPAQVILARDNVLEYVLSSSRLAGLPQSADWQLEAGEASEKEYGFCSGDWQVRVWLADADDGNHTVIIINKVNHTSWTGYVTPKGHVVDTAYGR
jgi:hypothetical protein